MTSGSVILRSKATKNLKLSNELDFSPTFRMTNIANSLRGLHFQCEPLPAKQQEKRMYFLKTFNFAKSQLPEPGVVRATVRTSVVL